MELKELTAKFWAKYFDNKENAKVYNWLNKDNFGGFYGENGTAWIELTYSGASLPNYIHKILVNFIKANGYKYLYEKEQDKC